MKLTKYAQSCVLIEDSNIKILVDPGYLLVDANTEKAWENPDYILVTHKHADHFDEKTIKKIISLKTKIYATKETADFYPNTKFELIKKNDILNLGSIKVEVVKSVHGYFPLLKGGKEAFEEVGFIFDNNKTRIYHTGDTICFPNEYKCDIIMLPYNNHGVCMSPFEAALFAKETNAKLVIPIHEDNPNLPADKTKFEEELKKNNLNYKFLQIGESIEI